MNTLPNNIYYSFNRTEDKHVFAALFNSFIANWDLAFQHLYKQIKGKVSTKEADQIINSLFLDADTISLTDWEYIIDKLKYFFPFIHVLDTTKRDNVKATLLNIYKQADEYRNYTTHYNRELKVLEHNLVEVLDIVCFSAVRLTQSKRKQAFDQEQIKDRFKDDIQTIVSNTNKRSKKKGSRFKVKEEEEYAHVFNHLAGKYINFKTEGLRDGFKTQIEAGKIQNTSLLFFMSFGLNRKQIEWTLDKSKFYKNTSGLEHAFTRWVVTAYCFREPKGTLSSHFSKDALMLQMADELSKCPRELYNHLDPKHQNEFIEDVQALTKETNNGEQNYEHWILRKRYEDKFTYLAIRFLDEYINFPSLRFQVNIGKFRHDSREKIFETGRSVRNIDEKLIAFERLSIVHKKKYRYFEEANANEYLTGWQPFPKPSYQFHKNNIGIRFTINKSPEGAPNERSKISKYDIAEQLKLKDKVNIPLAYLSFNELMALLHFVLVGKPEYVSKTVDERAEEAEDLIKRAYYQKKKEIGKREIKSKKIKLFNPQTDVLDIDKLKQALIKAIDYRPINPIRERDTFEQKEKRKEQKKEDQDYTNSEKGKIATWLVKDIVKYIPKQVREDIKGWQVSEFQNLLAYYDTHKADLKTFVELELIKACGYKGLAFNVFNFQNNSLKEFTNAYLKQRKKYLKTVKREVLKGNITQKENDIFSKYRVFRAKNYIVSKDYTNNLQKMPMYLPRGLFDDSPTFFKNNADGQRALWFEYANEKLNDKQVFYSFPRNYIFGNNEDPKKKKRKIFDGTKGITDVFKAEKGTEAYKDIGDIYKNEKVLSRLQRQDVFLLEMLKYGLGIQDEITLKQTFKTKAEKERFRIESRKEENEVANEDDLFSSRIQLELFDGRIQEKIGLKDVHKYRRLEKDQRAQNIVRYNENQPLTLDELYHELFTYDRIRQEEIFKFIHEIESPIYTKAETNGEVECLNQMTRDGEKVLNFKRYMAYGYIEHTDDQNAFISIEFEKDNGWLQVKEKFECKPKIYHLAILTYLRNKIAHNQYPSTEVYIDILRLYGEKPFEQTYIEWLFGVMKTIKLELQSHI